MAHYSSLDTYDNISTINESPNPGCSSPNDENSMRRQSFTFFSTGEMTRPSYYEAKEWTWELLAWIFGTCVIAGSVTILYKFNQAPLWHQNIQLSTVIAVLAQTTQSALLVTTESCISQLKWKWFENSRRTVDLEYYDQASRGPWGSLNILFRLSRQPRIVHLGALATIFMVVFPVFFQQALKTSVRSVEDPAASAQITFATTYKPLPSSSIMVGRNLAQGYLDQYLLNTVISSMVADSKDHADIPAMCSSGKCTFDSYTTLALCQSTEDITSQLINQPPNNTMGLLGVTIPGIEVNEEATLWATTIMGSEFGGLSFTGMKPDARILTLKHPNSNMDDIAHVYLAHYDPCFKGEVLRPDTNNPGFWRAYKATFRLCLQTRSTEFNISTTTRVTQTHSDISWDNDTVSLNNDTNPGFDGFRTARLENSGANYTVKSSSLLYLGGQIAKAFDVSATLLTGGDPALNGELIGTNLVNDILGNEPVKCPNVTGYGFEGFTNRITHIAHSVTNAFLTSNSSQVLHGKAFQSVQYYNVNFWLLAIPGSLYLLVTIFFATTVLYTTGVPLWKSSQLAVLYSMNKTGLGTKSAMEKKAKKTHIRFSEEDWNLKHI